MPTLVPFLLTPKHIRPMQPIKKSNGAVVQVKFLVMQIMHLRFTSKEIIPTVHGGSIEELVCQISPKGQDMAPQDLRW